MNDITSSSSLTTLAESGLLFGCVLDGRGGATDVDWESAMVWSPGDSDSVLWLHLDRTVPGVDAWLANKLDVSEATADALVSNETSPRAFAEGEALIAILRGVNFNEGADPDDMIALQLWADKNYVISLRRRHMQSPRQILAALHSGDGPHNSGELVSDLAAKLVANMAPRIISMNERIDVLEEAAMTQAVESKLDEIAGIRRSCLGMKRFMSPQFDALQQLQAASPTWMSDDDKKAMRETTERLKRYLDAIDVSKESVIVLQDDLNNRAAQQAGSTMYMLSIVAAIFLPLSFITGLLGINVGGMPGVGSSAAFWVTVFILTGILGVQLYVFRRLKWL